MSSPTTIYTVNYGKRCIEQYCYSDADTVKALYGNWYENYQDALEELEEFGYDQYNEELDQ